MRAALDQVFAIHAKTLNPDLVEYRDLLKNEKRIMQERCFKEEDLAKVERLFREFDTIGDKENAEKQMLILCNYPDNTGAQEAEYWGQYARFSLKYNMHCTAEHYLKQRYARSAKQEEIQ